MSPVIPPDRLSRYEKILARALRGSTESERATAKERLEQMERNHPGIREAFIAARVAEEGAKRARDAANSAQAAASAWAGADPLLQSVVRLGQAHANRVIDALFANATDTLVDLLTPSKGPPKMPSSRRRTAVQPTSDELIENYAGIEIEVDDEEDVDDPDAPVMLIFEVSVPLEAWEDDRRGVFTWINKAVEDGLEEIAAGDPDDAEDEDEDDEDDDSEEADFMPDFDEDPPTDG